MLLLSSRILEHELSDEGRLRLLERLQEREFIPLIRSTRLNCFEQAVFDMNRVGEMERLVAASTDADEQTSYIEGDIFCFTDHVFFLLFGDREQGTARMRAGIVYEPQTAEPLRKLNSFCQLLSLCLADADGQTRESAEDVAATQMTAWRPDSSAVHSGFIRFVAKQDADILSTIACRENSRARVRAAKLLEDDRTRIFLRRAREAYTEGYPVTSSADGATPTSSELTVSQLLEAGLLRREILVSCRKSGHMLFSLPSADALAVVTISQARCSECGANIADEKVEEVLSPTQFSSHLMEDGAWLVNRLHAILRGLGITESEIAVEPPAGNGEARMMVRVCGETFLIVMRDGDLTPAFARRAINAKLETEARHLLVVTTGTIHNEGRTSLVHFAKRVERGGNDFEMLIADGTLDAEEKLRLSFERVAQAVLAEQLCQLDASIGLSVPHLITTRFQMLRASRGDDKSFHLPVPVEHDQGLHNTAQVAPLTDFNLLEIND